jgi:hypothetical protein
MPIAISAEQAIRLSIIAFALVAMVYVCTGSGLWSSDNWWEELPDHKRKLFIAAIGVSILQTFL